MPKVVDVGNGQYVQFPDEMSDDAISAALAPKSSAWGAAYGHALNSGLMGFSDEMEGGWKALAKKVLPTSLGGTDLPIGEQYRQDRDIARQRLTDTKQEHPTASLAGDIGGALLPAVATLGAGAPASGPGILGQLAAKSPTAARLLRAGAVGAAWGAPAALGNSDADLTEGEYGKAAKDTAIGAGVGAGLGMGFSQAGQAIKPLAKWLRGVAVDQGRRYLSGTATSLSRAKPLSDPAVMEAFAQGAIKPGTTIKSGAATLNAAREDVGNVYGRIVDALDANGIRGPEAEALAQQYAEKAAAAKNNSFSPGVASAYSRPANQLREIAARMRPSLALSEAAAGGEPITGISDYQRLMGQEPRGQLADLLSERAAGPIPSPGAPSLSGPRPPAAMPEPSEWAFLAHPDALRGGADLPSSAWLPSNTEPSSGLAEALAASPRLRLSQGENLKRSLQDQARSAYAQQRPGEVGNALMDSASVMRQANEDAITQGAAASGDPMVQAIAEGFVPVKDKLSRIIQASDAATLAAQRAARNHAIGLKEVGLAAGNPAKLAAAILLKGRGTSTIAAGAMGAANALDSVQPSSPLRELLLRELQQRAGASNEP